MSCIVLLTLSVSATDCYQDEEVHFQYRLIRIYEMDAREVMDNNLTCLMPFVPLMRHGPELIVQAENRINDSDMPRKDQADMLTSMAILSGLISRELPKEMIGRRRDLMIESAAYDLLMELAREDVRDKVRDEVRDEVMKEGIEVGEKKGKEEGKKEGIEEGKKQEFERSVRKMLMRGFKPDEVAAILEVDKEKVLRIVDSLSQPAT